MSHSATVKIAVLMIRVTPVTDSHSWSEPEVAVRRQFRTEQCSAEGQEIWVAVAASPVRVAATIIVVPRNRIKAAGVEILDLRGAIRSVTPLFRILAVVVEILVLQAAITRVGAQSRTLAVAVVSLVLRVATTNVVL